MLKFTKVHNSTMLHVTSGPATMFGSPRPGTRGGGGSWGHIPYRNCMLTMVLRDSLGEHQRVCDYY